MLCLPQHTRDGRAKDGDAKMSSGVPKPLIRTAGGGDTCSKSLAAASAALGYFLFVQGHRTVTSRLRTARVSDDLRAQLSLSRPPCTRPIRSLHDSLTLPLRAMPYVRQETMPTIPPPEFEPGRDCRPCVDRVRPQTVRNCKNGTMLLRQTATTQRIHPSNTARISASFPRNSVARLRVRRTAGSLRKAPNSFVTIRLL